MGLLKFIGRLFRGEVSEAPPNPLTHPAEWLEWLEEGRGSSASGVRVTHRAALGFPAIWRAVNKISDDVAKTELLVYRRVDGGKDRDPGHPAYQLLRHKASKYVTSFVFKQTMEGHRLLHGNGYALIYRTAAGMPTELRICDPTKVIPTRLETGERFYTITDSNGQQHTVPGRDMLHIRGLGGDELCGYSLLEYAKDAIGLGIAATRWASGFFKRGAAPGVLLEVPGNLKPDQVADLRNSWNAMHAGSEQNWMPAVLQGGLTAKPYAVDPDKAKLIDQRKFDAREIANLFGIPPHILGDDLKSSYKSLEAESQSYLDGLDSHLVAWETECRDKLLTEPQKQRDTHTVEFVRQALVRVDMKTRGEFFNKAVAGVPYMLLDEVRAFEGLPPLPDGVGSKLIIPINISKPDEDEDETDDDSNQDEETSGTDGDDEGDGTESDDGDRSTRAVTEAHQALVRDTLARLCRRVRQDALRASRDGPKFCNWLDGDGFGRHVDVARENLGSVVRAILVARGEYREFEHSAFTTIAAGDFAEVVGRRLGQVAETATADELADAIDRDSEEWLEAASGSVMRLLWSDVDETED